MKSTRPALKSARHFPQIRKLVAQLAPTAATLADAIADLAEPPLLEERSAELLRDYLAKQGMKVSRPWKDLPTAFLAAAGAGRPRIALMAEYDALPECGARPGQFGHGCGHNLLGVAAATAGAVAGRLARERKLRGTVHVIGTPAEETLGGKVQLAQRGAFDGYDAILAWHPSTVNRVTCAGGAAMDSVLFEFFGRTAHAAGGPHLGRSALDAALLMDTSVNFLREHVEENVRMHSVIVDGGKAPNVVPDHAAIWYYLRGRDRAQVDDVRRRVLLCARAAAMATETTTRHSVLTCCTERILNPTIAGMLDGILRAHGAPKLTPADVKAAARILPGKTYQTEIQPVRMDHQRASSDEDNVSWFAPLAALQTACIPKDVVGHHRDYARAAKLPGAHRGMLKAAGVLASGVVELFTNAPLLAKAQKDFTQNMKGKKYAVPVSRNALKVSLEQAERTRPKAE